jgi:hypothetical protein
MGYYIRVLAIDATPITVDELFPCLPVTPAVELTVEAGNPAVWSQLVLRHVSGQEIAVIEKNDVSAGELGADEIAEFIEEIRDAQPLSAARWLTPYFPRVKTIYAFQLLKGTDVDDGWSAVHALQGRIWAKRGGILQADGEGFSNEDGYYILWQFADHVEGPWNMAVVDTAGQWTAFEMNLGNREQRAIFLVGQVPEGVRLL